MSGTGTANRTTEEEQGGLRRSLGFRDLTGGCWCWWGSEGGRNRPGSDGR
ncbi:hypothetical protein OG426_35405 [Streptomyces canus]|nr:hypothetical protein [Streptomyces canus]MCX4857284.1 hypothetical protein [Streptomyces canus]WSW37354.1 hypothetical protein OG426_35405 [Streptomyces canus]